MRNTLLTSLGMLALLTSLFPHSVDGQSTTQTPPTVKQEAARPIASVQGQDTYKAYCAVCHGLDAKGKGPAAPAMKVPPTDLTTLAQSAAGKFSAADIRQVIEGRTELPAHGSREMPIWGEVFRALESDSGMRNLRIKNLIDYLESLQVK